MKHSSSDCVSFTYHANIVGNTEEPKFTQVCGAWQHWALSYRHKTGIQVYVIIWLFESQMPLQYILKQ